MRFNFILILIVSLLLALLIKYTDVAQVGLFSYWNEGFSTIDKIIHGQPPIDTLTPIEKQKLQKEIEKNVITAPLFCQSRYFPFISGSHWRYQLTEGDQKKILTLDIPAPEENLTFLDGRLAGPDNWTVRSNVACQDNKILLSDLNFWEIQNQGQIITEPCDPKTQDLFLPLDSDFSAGNNWVENFCLNRKVFNNLSTTAENPSDKPREIKEDWQTYWEVLGIEEINVPAGNFSAQKIKITLTKKQQVGQEKHLVEADWTVWLVPEIGTVKISYQELSFDNQPSQKPPAIQELIDFQIPTEKEYKEKNF